MGIKQVNGGEETLKSDSFSGLGVGKDNLNGKDYYYIQTVGDSEFEGKDIELYISESVGETDLLEIRGKLSELVDRYGLEVIWDHLG